MSGRVGQPIIRAWQTRLRDVAPALSDTACRFIAATIASSSAHVDVLLAIADASDEMAAHLKHKRLARLESQARAVAELMRQTAAFRVNQGTRS